MTEKLLTGCKSSSQIKIKKGLDLSESDLATCISLYRLAPQCPEQNSSSYSHPAGSLDLSDSDADASKEKVHKAD